MKWFERFFKWGLFCFTVLFIGFLYISNVEPYPLSVNQSYTNYEVKRATHNAFGVQTNVVRNAWAWTRRVNRIDVIKLSTTTVYCKFTVKVSSFGTGYTVPTDYSSDWYIIPAGSSSVMADNIYTFDIVSDEFSVYIATCTTPDVRVIGYGY